MAEATGKAWSDGLGASTMAMVSEAPLAFFLGPLCVGVLALMGMSLHPLVLAPLLLAWACSVVSYHGSRTSRRAVRVGAGIACAVFALLGLAAAQYWI